MTQQINQPLANVVARCIRNSPDSKTKRREVAKLRLMFGGQLRPDRDPAAIHGLQDRERDIDQTLQARG